MIRVIRLYTPQKLRCGDQIRLDKKSSHHLLRVLRAKMDGQVKLFNGDGFDYTATVLDSSLKNATLLVDKKSKTTNESPLNITLLQGISRGDKMDVTLQKSVELGINRFVPVTCKRSNYSIKADRKAKKLQHWQQILISACEQSGRAVIPELSDVTSFDRAICLNKNYIKILLYPDAEHSISELAVPENNKVCIFIGPEGGLSPEEISLATEKSFQEIRFGPRILRTETAGPAVISAVQTLWGDI